MGYETDYSGVRREPQKIKLNDTIGSKMQRHRLDTQFDGNIDMNEIDIFENILRCFNQYFIEFRKRRYIDLYNPKLKNTTSSLVRWIYLLRVKILKVNYINRTYMSLRSKLRNKNFVGNIDMLDEDIHDNIMSSFNKFFNEYQRRKRSKYQLYDNDINQSINNIINWLIVSTEKLSIIDMQQKPLKFKEFDNIKFCYIVAENRKKQGAKK